MAITLSKFEGFEELFILEDIESVEDIKIELRIFVFRWGGERGEGEGKKWEKVVLRVCWK